MTIEAADDLRSAFTLICLPAQRDFIDDTSHRIVGYIGGLVLVSLSLLARKIIWLGILNPQADDHGLRANLSQ